jgi:beta-glucosidase
MVLLRNDGQLPFGKEVATLAVIGCHAADARFFFGGYTHFSMAEGMLAANASMAGITSATQVKVENTIPGTGIQDDSDPAFGELLASMYPGIPTLLDELRRRLPHTNVIWARGYPIAGNDDSGHAEAMAVAADADLVLLTIGGKHGTSSIASMGEGIDATSINLPQCQELAIVKLATLGKPMIGVHLDGRPVSSDVADAHLDALIEAWNPAEYGARAIVDVLLGDENPSGRLPVSVARNAGQIPVYYNHPFGSSWHQGDSIGFADYVDAPHTPRYHFGHGMSYTRFEYHDLMISAEEMDAAGAIDVRATIRNVGARQGTEIVQFYARDRYASMSRPVLELVGFQRVTLEPGRAAEVTFEFRPSQLAFLDADMRWLVEAGDFDLLVGASSDDLHDSGVIRVTNSMHVDGRSRGFVAKSQVAYISAG